MNEHDPACPIEVNKKALAMWRRGFNDATKKGVEKPAKVVLAETFNLYETYLLGIRRGAELVEQRSPQ